MILQPNITIYNIKCNKKQLQLFSEKRKYKLIMVVNRKKNVVFDGKSYFC